MLKRILSAVGVVVAGFVVVVAVVYWQLRHVEGTLHQNSRVDVPLYKAAVAVTERTADLEKVVSTSFLSLNHAELDERRRATREGIEQLNAGVKRLNSKEFASVHNAVIAAGLSAPTLPGNTNPPGVIPGGKAGVGGLISSLTTNLSELGTIAERTVALAGEQLALRQNLETSKEELSKVYRKAFSLAKVDEKAFTTLSRAVITTLYSSSTRDLNFIGRSKFKEGQEALSKATLTPEQKELLDGVAAQFNKTFESAIAASAAKADWALFADRVSIIKAQTARLRSFAETQFEEGQSNLTTNTRRTVTASLWLSLITITVGTLISFFIAKSITRRIGAVAERLRMGAQEVSQASLQMEATSSALSEGASSQAASLEQTSASLTEMAAMTKQNSTNAQSAKELSVGTRAAAETGSREIKEMEVAMSAMRESSNSIGKIVKSIDEIAFQTNILALNAAVEAARAGEAGQGFAVVADEVRNLAQRSALAARETADKIEDTIEKSERGVQLSAKVAQSLQAIVTKALQVDQLIGEIAIASREQSDGVGQITSAVSQVDKVTQQAAASAEEGAAAAIELRTQAATLCESIEDLSRLVGNNSTQSSTEHPTPSGSPAARMPHLIRAVNAAACSELLIPEARAAKKAIPRSERPTEAQPQACKDF